MFGKILFSLIIGTAAALLVQHTITYEHGYPSYRSGLVFASFADGVHSLEIQVYLLPLAANAVLAALAAYALFCRKEKHLRRRHWLWSAVLLLPLAAAVCILAVFGKPYYLSEPSHSSHRAIISNTDVRGHCHTLTLAGIILPCLINVPNPEFRQPEHQIEPLPATQTQGNP